MSNTVGRLQQKNCIVFYFCLLIVVACITAKIENDFVLQIFVKAASEKGLQKFISQQMAFGFGVEYR